MEFEIWRRHADDGGTQTLVIPASGVLREQALEVAKQDLGVAELDEAMELVGTVTADNWDEAEPKIEDLVFHWEHRN